MTSLEFLTLCVFWIGCLLIVLPCRQMWYELKHFFQRKKPLGVILVTVINVNTKGIRQIMDIKITTEEQRLVAVQILTASGKPAKVDGAIKWEVIEGDSIRVLSSPKGTKAKLIPTGTEGFSLVEITADADLGEGVESLVGAIEITVEAPKAAVLLPQIGETVPLELDPQPPED